MTLSVIPNVNLSSVVGPSKGCVLIDFPAEAMKTAGNYILSWEFIEEGRRRQGITPLPITEMVAATQLPRHRRIDIRCSTPGQQPARRFFAQPGSMTLYEITFTGRWLCEHDKDWRRLNLTVAVVVLPHTAHSKENENCQVNSPTKDIFVGGRLQTSYSIERKTDSEEWWTIPHNLGLTFLRRGKYFLWICYCLDSAIEKWYTCESPIDIIIN